MKKFIYNKDKFCKSMQTAGLKQSLSELKKLEVFGPYNIEPILCSIENIILCYNCIASTC